MLNNFINMWDDLTNEKIHNNIFYIRKRNIIMEHIQIILYVKIITTEQRIKY